MIKILWTETEQILAENGLNFNVDVKQVIFTDPTNHKDLNLTKELFKKLAEETIYDSVFMGNKNPKIRRDLKIVGDNFWLAREVKKEYGASSVVCDEHWAFYRLPWYAIEFGKLSDLYQ